MARAEAGSAALYLGHGGEAIPGKERELVSQVWVAGDRGHWELDGTYREEKRCIRMTFDAEHAVYASPEVMRDLSPLEMLNAATFRQGLAWHMGIHELVRLGLPDNARIAENRETDSGRVVVLEAEFEEARTFLGLGLRHLFLGRQRAVLKRIRLHVKVPEFEPIIEERSFKGTPNQYRSRIEIGPEYLDFGDQRAPASFTVTSTQGQAKKLGWTFRVGFQKVENVWLLREAEGELDGEVKCRLFTEGISTEPADPALFEMPVLPERPASEAAPELGEEESAEAAEEVPAP